MSDDQIPATSWAVWAWQAYRDGRLVEANRIEELEAKLAKAVEALRFYAWENEARLPSEGPWGVASTDFGQVARATLAELKGETDE